MPRFTANLAGKGTHDFSTGLWRKNRVRLRDMNNWHHNIAFVILYIGSLSAQAGLPLPSQFVECVRDDKGLDVGSRTVRTRVVASKTGSRAYGKVVAKPERGCRNTSTIFVSEPTQSFRVVFEQSTEAEGDGSGILNGNGVEAILWSPSGSRLLVEISQWIWGSDTDVLTKYLVYEPQKPVTVIKPVETIWKTFKQPCTALIESRGWIDNNRIELEVKPFLSTDEEGIPDGTPICLEKAMKFSFDVEMGTLEQLPTRRTSN
jgi:hypothetical protein